MVAVDGVPEPHTGWTFVTSHARVLASIADNHSARIRDIAARCRLTERAVQKIISDLERDGYLSHTRSGRSNQYRIDPSKVLRHPAEAGLTVASLLSLLVRDEADRKGAVARDDEGTSPGPVSDDDRPAGAGRAQPEPPGTTQYESHGARVFVAHGAYDAASIAPLADALRAAADTYSRVVVDARGVSFADSTFLNLLISVHHATDLRVVAPSAQLRRLLELTGADKALKVRAGLEEATE
ncbi:anti-anti-sigma factor [Streptomyces sp. Ag109_O5-10]|nr:anti-anti-sigma factor [Streptomyces sp. Ag109_O5-10]